MVLAALPASIVAENRATVNDGVFSEEQFRRGEMLYLEHCRECHERDLMGGGYEDTPPIIGEEFLSNWLTWTVGDLFDFLQNEMPPRRRNRVGITPQTYIDILAYVLQRNGYPTGEEELPPDFEPLSLIEMTTTD